MFKTYITTCGECGRLSLVGLRCGGGGDDNDHDNDERYFSICCSGYLRVLAMVADILNDLS